ncbi:MAG: hypothetical protein ACR2PT_21840 [Endozoicomonas sp.]
MKHASQAIYLRLYCRFIHLPDSGQALVFDAFFSSMAITITLGLGFATVLKLLPKKTVY